MLLHSRPLPSVTISRSASAVRPGGWRRRCSGTQRGRSVERQPAVTRQHAAHRGAPGPVSCTLDGTHLNRATMLPQGPSAAAAVALFLFLSLEPTLVPAFNLDTSHVIRKDGDPGSLFGFSLAMHRQLNPDKRM